jgi:hypothetical protein
VPIRILSAAPPEHAVLEHERVEHEGVRRPHLEIDDDLTRDALGDVGLEVQERVPLGGGEELVVVIEEPTNLVLHEKDR